MAQIFRPRANSYWKLIVISILGLLIMTAVVAETMKRSPYITEVGVPIQQPVPFSHKHHVGGLGLDCRYCHTSVERSPFAGMPPTHTCMTCHSQLFTHSKMLEPVRQSYKEDKPLHWQRVYRLPDYVYFDHSVHVKHGVGCASCHGQIDQMPLTWRHRSFYMDDCLACHNNPGPSLRPENQIFNLNWTPPEDQKERKTLADKLLKRYQIPSPRRLTDCYVCHR